MIEKKFMQTPQLMYIARKDILNSMKSLKYIKYFLIFLLLSMFIIIPIIFLGLYFFIENSGLILNDFFVEYSFILLYISIPIIFLLLVGPLFQYFNSRKETSYLKTYIFSKDNIKCHSINYNITLEWKVITHLQISKELFLLFTSKNCANFVPIDLFSEEEINTIYNWYELNKEENICTRNK